MDEEKYMDLVKNQIELDKLFAQTNPIYHEQIRELLKQKKEIIKENGFFAAYKLNKINKKIENIKQKSKKNL